LGVEVSLLRRDEGSDVNREPTGKDGAMGKESNEGNRYDPWIANESKMFRSRETGRRYAISKVLNKGLLFLKSEDGMSLR
jgi:hypothetical protein